MEFLHDANAIPDELIKRDQWVLWKMEERNGKNTKPPIDPKTGKPLLIHFDLPEPTSEGGCS